MVSRLCIVGLGFIGSTVIRHLEDLEQKIKLQAIFDIDKERMLEVKK
ncbi:MAG: hypothetical protein H7641_10385, partial [Candidatus Heimdallarchaeota archaeon]|nr:hypothetical protein [Candidatus Heimdallarchaeota archaeon]